MGAGMLGVKARDAELKRSMCSTKTVQTLPKASYSAMGALPFGGGQKGKRRKGKEKQTEGNKHGNGFDY